MFDNSSPSSQHIHHDGSSSQIDPTSKVTIIFFAAWYLMCRRIYLIQHREAIDAARPETEASALLIGSHPILDSFPMVGIWSIK